MAVICTLLISLFSLFILILSINSSYGCIPCLEKDIVYLKYDLKLTLSKIYPGKEIVPADIDDVVDFFYDEDYNVQYIDLRSLEKTSAWLAVEIQALVTKYKSLQSKEIEKEFTTLKARTQEMLVNGAEIINNYMCGNECSEEHVEIINCKKCITMEVSCKEVGFCGRWGFVSTIIISTIATVILVIACLWFVSKKLIERAQRRHAAEKQTKAGTDDAKDVKITIPEVEEQTKAETVKAKEVKITIPETDDEEELEEEEVEESEEDELEEEEVEEEELEEEESEEDELEEEELEEEEIEEEELEEEEIEEEEVEEEELEEKESEEDELEEEELEEEEIEEEEIEEEEVEEEEEGSEASDT